MLNALYLSVTTGGCLYSGLSQCPELERFGEDVRAVMTIWCEYVPYSIASETEELVQNCPASSGVESMHASAASWHI